MAETQKRDLKFESLDDIAVDANRLLQSGYESAGKWNLAETCFHLIEWSRFPMDGFPKPPWFMRIIFGTMKMVGMVEKMKRDILENGFKDGLPTDPRTVSTADRAEDARAVQQLTELVQRMKEYDGPLHPSPLFGEMDREMWEKVTKLHCEHHLAFLSAKES